jgi:hypothetical protein
MRYVGKSLLVAAAFLVFGATAGQAACCSYGCCDCSCVGLKSEAKAAKLSRALGGRGRLQSFTIDASDNKSTPAPFKCSAEREVAVCTRQ